MSNNCNGLLKPLTYDAMYCLLQKGRVEVPDIRPNGAHIHREFNTMSDMFDDNKPKPTDIPGVDELKDKAQQAYDSAPPEVKQAVEQSKSFYEENKRAIHTVIVGAVVLRVYKKKVAKHTAKAVVKALAKSDVSKASSLPDLTEIWEELKKTPNMAYIPIGGGMVHLLGPSEEVIVTVFGNFEKMRNAEIFDVAAKALGLRY